MARAQEKDSAPAALVDYRVVSREFDGAGDTRAIGEVVNINDPAWRNAGLLEQLRYLRPMPAGHEPVKAKNGRLFIDEASAKAHDAAQRKAQQAARRTARSTAEG
jgi:hypothetical protein